MPIDQIISDSNDTHMKLAQLCVLKRERGRICLCTNSNDDKESMQPDRSPYLDRTEWQEHCVQARGDRDCALSVSGTSLIFDCICSRTRNEERQSLTNKELHLPIPQVEISSTISGGLRQPPSRKIHNFTSTRGSPAVSRANDDRATAINILGLV